VEVEAEEIGNIGNEDELYSLLLTELWWWLPVPIFLFSLNTTGVENVANTFAASRMPIFFFFFKKKKLYKYVILLINFIQYNYIHIIN